MSTGPANSRTEADMGEAPIGVARPQVPGTGFPSDP